MKKSDHDHYVDLNESVKPTMIATKKGWLIRFKCPVCELIFDLPVKVEYDSDINERGK